MTAKTDAADWSVIAEAFSRTAEKYDRLGVDNPHLTRLRQKVYDHFLRFVRPGARVLELAAGTGTDAVALAQRGLYIHATDIAPGMLTRLEQKVRHLGLERRVTWQQCSFTDLAQVRGAPYDAVFSNLGGLNCLPDLRPVIQDLPLVLRPGGVVTWVLMPRVCLWELAMLFTGQVRFALRRFSPHGTRAHLEGLHFKVYYFSPDQALAAFGPNYEPLAVEGLSVITPPAESVNLARRHPRLYRALAWLDDRLSTRPPWWGWGDFFILSVRYRPVGP